MPAIADVGLMDEIVGERIENVKLLDRNELPLTALTTATFTLPGVVSMVAGTAAVNWFALPKKVVKLVLFHNTALAVLKELPVTVRVNAGLPAAAEPGETPVIAGGETTNGTLAESTVLRKSPL